MAQKEEFMFQNVAYRPTVYKTEADMYTYLLGSEKAIKKKQLKLQAIMFQ